MKYQKYTVEGDGRFPVDMLRYDQSFPDSELDAGKIYNSVLGVSLVKHQITLGRYVQSKNNLPKEVRWASFGWYVVPKSIQTA